MSHFVNEARSGEYHPSLYVITFIAVLFAVVLGTTPYVFVSLATEVLNDGPSYIQLALMLLGHVAGLVVLWLCVVKVLKRRWISVVTTRRPFDWRRFFFAAGLWFLLTAAVEVVMFLIAPDNYRVPEFEPGRWIPLMLVACAHCSPANFV